MRAADDKTGQARTASPSTSGSESIRTLPRGVRYDAWHRRCMGCDYDLAGLPDECRCPECGVEIVPGLRSAKVWCMDQPSMVLLITQTPVALMFILGFILSLVVVGDACMIFFFGFMAIAGAFAVRDTFSKVRAKSAGQRDGTLHFWPRTARDVGGVGLRHERHRDRLWWFRWSEVRRVRVRRPPLSRYWVIRIKGPRKWYLLGWRHTLKAVAPFTRREIALLRNTLRRHWRRAVAAEGGR